MKNIQEYIDLLKDEKAKAEKSAQLFIDCGDNDYTDYHRGLVEAFALALSKAELLLIPQPNNDVQPQLNKPDVIGSALADYVYDDEYQGCIECGRLDCDESCFEPEW